VSERDYHDRHYAAEADAIEGSALFARVHRRGARQFARCTRLQRSHRVLSLGCGDGAIECLLAPYAEQIVGVDISSVAIDRARTRAHAAGLQNVSFDAVEDTHAGLDKLGQFDVVAAFAFLHHLGDAATRDTLSAVRRALVPGGQFYSADPSRRRLVGVFTGLVREAYDRYHSPDERELDPEALAALVEAAGFDRVVVGYTDYFLGPLAWLAPGTPSWLTRPLEAIDNLALGVPFVRRYASSFSLHARVA
jgi:SAM-dependent methyltransferase